VKKITLIIAGLFLFFVSSCNSTEANETENADSTEVVVEKTVDVDTITTNDEVNENLELGEEYTARYICPNHCKKSGSDKEGECSNCGMEFMENPNFQEK